MQMRVGPPERRLQHLVQSIESHRRSQVEAPPDGRLRSDEVGSHAEADGVGAGRMPQLWAISIEVVGEASTTDLFHGSSQAIDRQPSGDLREPTPHFLVIHRESRYRPISPTPGPHHPIPGLGQSMPSLERKSFEAGS